VTLILDLFSGFPFREKGCSTRVFEAQDLIVGLVGSLRSKPDTTDFD
jgi:hypothetical protein